MYSCHRLDPHGGFFDILFGLRSRKWPHDVPSHGHAPHRPPRSAHAGRLAARQPHAAYAKLAAGRAASYESVRSAWHGLRRTLTHSDPRRLRLLSTPHSRQYTLQSDRNSVLSLSLSRFSLLSTLDSCLRSRHCRLVSRRPFSLGLSPPPSLSRTAHMQRLSKVVSQAPCATISYDLESELQALCTATTAAARIVWLRHPRSPVSRHHELASQCYLARRIERVAAVVRAQLRHTSL